MTRQPVLFVSHGSPMLALEGPDHPYARALREFAPALPEAPRAVLAVSAHWETGSPLVTSSPRPGVLHDFGGFPRALFELDYPAPGDPALADRTVALLGSRGLASGLDPRRPLDHGAWAVLRHLFPGAAVPVVQMSLPRRDPADLLALGAALAPLREEGVLLLASGGLVHHLGTVDFQAPDERVAPWAREAEGWFLDRILDPLRDPRREDLLDHRARWPGSRQAAPTTEHLDPVFVALGAGDGDSARTIHRGWQLGTMSLATLAWG